VKQSQTWLTFCILFLTTGASAGEWPKWLGPDGTGVSTDKIVEQWPADGPKHLWSKKVGLGFSSLVGLNGKVYFFAMQGADDVLTAMDAESGNVLWSQSYAVTHKAVGEQASNGENGLPLPEATPTIDGDRIYTYGGGGDLVCRNLSDGAQVWKINVLDETGAKIITWNEASSPLVAGQLVYVQGGDGGAVAVGVDKSSGKIAWKSKHGLGGYAAPILADVDGKPELIIFGGNALYGFEPATGKTLWEVPWITQYQVNATTPIYHEGHLFISSGYGHGCAMFKLTAARATLEWSGKQISSKYQACILQDGKLYGNSGGVLKCLSWPLPKQVWSTHEVKLNEGGSFIIDGNQMITLSDKGTLSLVHLDPDGPKVMSEIDIFPASRDIWSAPIIYHGKLFVKGKDELVCLDISAK
jgi:outer membrane protein assembly factor BamB